MKTLHELGLQYQTDKAVHKYLDVYSSVFEPLRLHPINLLEVGVYQGASIRMWKDYFINGNIYGLDIIDKTHLIEERISIEKGSQESKKDLLDCFPGKTFQIIIDDGGHGMLHQQNSLIYLFNRLERGGYYIIEDLHTSYLLHRQKSHNPTNSKTTLNLLYELSIFQPSQKDVFLDFFTGYTVPAQDILNVYNQIDFVRLCFTKRTSATSIIKKN